MKRLFFIIAVFSLIIGTSGISVNASELQGSKILYTVEVIDNSSNQLVEIQVLSEELNPIVYAHSATAEQQEVEYDVTFLLPVNSDDKTRASVSSEKEEASIHAKIKLTYTISADEKSINVSNVSGLWECTSASYSMTFSDRTVAVTDGRPLSVGNTLTMHPTANTFSYDTGWGYVPYYPASTDAMTGARAYSEATGTIEGMGGSYTLYVMVAVP